MHVGGSLMVNGRAYTVLAYLPTGEVKVEDIMTGDVMWVDWYAVRAVDPHTRPEAVLEALAELDPTEEPDKPRASLPSMDRYRRP